MVSKLNPNLKRIVLDIPLEDFNVAYDEAERLDSSVKRVIKSWIHQMALSNKDKLNELISKNIDGLLNDLRSGRKI